FLLKPLLQADVDNVVVELLDPTVEARTPGQARQQGYGSISTLLPVVREQPVEERTLFGGPQARPQAERRAGRERDEVEAIPFQVLDGRRQQGDARRKGDVIRIRHVEPADVLPRNAAVR